MDKVQRSYGTAPVPGNAFAYEAALAFKLFETHPQEFTSISVADQAHPILLEYQKV